jgi:hypothetical protein
MAMMIQQRPFIGLLMGVTLLCLAPTAHAIEGSYGSTQDPSSYSNVDQFQPQHFSLDFVVNFEDSTTSGTITHTVVVLEANITTVFMDVWDAVVVSEAHFSAPTIGKLEMLSKGNKRLLF